eukprot:TRINITY_DN42923_c0_g1_i1.p1 TRINITY_DN42923_c0_g1~~TRINITY_DN42923_c0_g1_i1.p1  ORF type:complete len:434 (+),score=179.74 TRINITY_DN42923_c0_g1_i1:78-1379(+)
MAAAEQTLTREPSGGTSTMGITRMAGDTVMGQETAPVDDGTMDEVIEKLKVLDYQVAFAKDSGGAGGKYGHPFKPLNRVQFCLSDNTGQQSFYFTSLVAWLVELCGGRFAKFDQYQEDPNVTATNIVQALKELRLETKDILPSKLVKGYGESVLLTLSMLCDEALKAKGFNFLPPEYPQEKPEDLDMVDEGETGDDGEIVDEVAVAADDSDDDEWAEAGIGLRTEDPPTMIESQVDPEKWKLELETVASQLKLSAQENMKDWRGHVEYISTMLKRLDGIFPDVRVSLRNVNEDIQRAVEKIQKREAHFAQHFQDTIEKYRELHNDLKQYQKTYDDGQQAVAQQSTKLNQLTEDLEHVKNEIQEREEQMSDSKPLVNIKRALADLKVEIKNMELRIGVLQHTVLHQTISQTSQKATGKKDEGNNSFADDGAASI